MMLGLSRVDRRLFVVGLLMWGVIPGVLALVFLRCVRGFVAMTRELVGLVVVVTGGGAVATSVATLCSLGSSPSVAILFGGCRSISIVAINLMMAFCRHYLCFSGNTMMYSRSLSCTALT